MSHNSHDWRQLLAGSRRHVREGIALLEHPCAEALDQCRLLLESSVAAIGPLAHELPALSSGDRPPLRAALHHLQRDLRRLERLLVASRSFYTRWIAAQIALTGRYGPDGLAAAAGGPSNLHLEG